VIWPDAGKVIEVHRDGTLQIAGAGGVRTETDISDVLLCQ
jgi:hypothetical protein